MNNDGKNNPEALHSLLLLPELEEGEPISQREIAGRLGIALGLVNSYLKTLAKKGFIQVKAYPRNRFAYLLTPQGFTEKSHLACRHLSNFHKLYRITRQESLTLFRTLRQSGVERVTFCGVDDLTEIAYLSLKEAGLELAAVMDEEATGSFSGIPVVSMSEGVGATSGPVVITSLPRAGQLKARLRKLGVADADIHAPAFSYEEILRGGGNP